MAYLPQFGFGAMDPNSGTYEDVNCPFYCWAAGNVLDMEFFGNHCWPCHNICPPSQPWDTTNLVCSGSPKAQGSLPAISPSGDGSGCPAGTAWNASGWPVRNHRAELPKHSDVCGHRTNRTSRGCGHSEEMITFLTRPTFKQAQAVKSLQTDGTARKRTPEATTHDLTIICDFGVHRSSPP